MRFGLVGSYGTLPQLLDTAQAADGCVWDGFFTWDSITLGAVDIWDPWVLLGAGAGRTPRRHAGQPRPGVVGRDLQP